MRILIIDDNQAIRDSLRRTLEYGGEVIVGAATGREGLALVERDTPDLVLLDVEMPGLSGLDVLNRLHTTHQSLPVVMMSAHVTPAIVVEAMRTGAVGFLEKPFENADRLLTTIHCAIEQARFRDETPGHQCAE
jgi:DNA-binding NtrC family response regulator